MTNSNTTDMDRLIEAMAVDIVKGYLTGEPAPVLPVTKPDTNPVLPATTKAA